MARTKPFRAFAGAGLAALAGAAAADDGVGAIAASVGCEEVRWLVAAGGSGFAEAGHDLRITVAGDPDPAWPATAGALTIALTVTVLEGDAAGVFGTGPALVTAQDIRYTPASGDARTTAAEGGAISVTLEDFARDGDTVRIAGTFTARLARAGAPADDAIPIEGSFDARLPRRED